MTLIHLIPSCFCDCGFPITLVDFTVPEFSLHLTEGCQIVARRPYPNKGYLVVNAISDRAAKNGIYIKTSAKQKVFTTVTRWAIGAEKVVSHRVQYEILDDRYNAASADPVIWYGWSKWGSRWPRSVPKEAPVKIRPSLKVYADGTCSPLSQIFKMPSLQIKRVLETAGKIYPGNRTPGISAAFIAGAGISNAAHSDLTTGTFR